VSGFLAEIDPLQGGTPAVSETRAHGTVAHVGG
jgi:hypothetical protein